MAKKKRGYVELYWTCPNCGGENPGSEEICGACGDRQPANVEFHQADEQQLVKDQEKLGRAKAGADIHCAYCGTRNPADAKQCSQCGSDLTEGKTRTSAGRVVGAFREGRGKPIACPSCGTENPFKNLKCQNCGTPLPHRSAEKKQAAKEPAPEGMSRRTLMIIGGVVLFLCAAIYFLFLRTTEVQGTVIRSEWSRSIVIEAYGEQQEEDWRDEIPSGAEIDSCSAEVRSTQNEAPSSGRYDEVCGTPYTVETGSGFAEVVQDCEYHVYDDYCSYYVLDWAPVSTAQLQGVSGSPNWPSPSLSSQQRLGEREENYVCVFDVDGDLYEYTTDSVQEYQLCDAGTVWTLQVNALGAVQSIER